ncbi:MAG: DNA primase, partial [Omnitrophica WOR_2 bacterium RBG_13_44_8b]
MRGLIPENILEDVLSRVDIVEVISGYMPLKRAGRNFKANCPFHHEKTPSFMVSPDRQIYHCFGCGESGNAFKFLMRHERMEFPEAVQMLARKAGVVLPELNSTDTKTADLITQLHKINEAAALFFENQLNTSSGQRAKDYLLKRGITKETIKLFQLGFAPDNWDALINHLRAKNFSLGLLEKAGLIVAKDGGGYYDRFRNRIIFPILDIKSRPVGFGARVMDDSLPKYINSPETPVYVKGRNLYGLNLSKDSIRDSDEAIIVEGYLDFIMPYQHGLTNIVASQGTALTVEQARLLKRYTQSIVMVYDADNAGELAALRSLDIFVEEEMNVRVVSLPKGFDPDLYVRKQGIDALKEKVKQALGLFDYKLTILKSRYNVKDIEDKAKVAASLLSTINKIKNAVLKSEYVKRLSQELDIREDALWQEVKKIKEEKPYPEFNGVRDGKKVLNIHPTEKLLIK